MFTKKTSRRARRGFSLLELLLVMSLAPIVFFVVYSNFAMGVRLWQRLQIATPEEDRAIFLIKARRDFQNMRRFSSLPFQGSVEEVAYASSIEAPSALGLGRGIGQVRYYFDDSSGAIFREVRDYSRLYEDKDGVRTLLLKGVRSFSLAYLVKEPPSSEYEWKEEYLPEKPSSLPMAVRLTYETDGASQPVEQTLIIGAGGALS